MFSISDDEELTRLLFLMDSSLVSLSLPLFASATPPRNRRPKQMVETIKLAIDSHFIIILPDKITEKLAVTPKPCLLLTEYDV